MKTQTIKLIFRNITQKKRYSSLSIGGFAIGLSVFIYILLFVDHEFRMDTGYAHHDRIFRLIDASDNNADLDYDICQILKEKYAEVQVVCPVRQKEKWPFMFQLKKNFIETESFISTTNEFFDQQTCFIQVFFRRCNHPLLFFLSARAACFALLTHQPFHLITPVANLRTPDLVE